MIFQDPMTSLNPVHRIGDQIVEQIQAHEDVSDAEARDRAVALLERVGIPRAARARRQLPARVLRRHAPARDDRDGAVVRPVGPHRRRADDRARRDDPGADPARDERPARAHRHRRSSSSPTTSASSPTSPTASRSCTPGGSSRPGTLDEIFYDPQHPYTWGLLGSITRIDRAAARAAAVDPGRAAVAHQPARGLPLPPALPARVRRVHEVPRRSRAGSRRRPATTTAAGCRSTRSASKRDRSPTGQIGLEIEGAIGVSADAATANGALLDVEHVKQYFPIRKGLLNRDAGHVHAVDDVTFDAASRARRSASSASRAAARRRCRARSCGCSSRPTGTITLPRHATSRTPGARELRPLRSDMQMVFQDPFASLNPRKRDRADHRRAAAAARRRRRARSRERTRRADGARRPRARAHQPLPARVLRRPAPAHRHRARARARAQAHRARRAGLARSTSRSRRRSSTCSRTCRTSSA